MLLSLSSYLFAMPALLLRLVPQLIALILLQFMTIITCYYPNQSPVQYCQTSFSIVLYQLTDRLGLSSPPPPYLYLNISILNYSIYLLLNDGLYLVLVLLVLSCLFALLILFYLSQHLSCDQLSVDERYQLLCQWPLLILCISSASTPSCASQLICNQLFMFMPYLLAYSCYSCLRPICQLLSFRSAPCPLSVSLCLSLHYLMWYLVFWTRVLLSNACISTSMRMDLQTYELQSSRGVSQLSVFYTQVLHLFHLLLLFFVSM